MANRQTINWNSDSTALNRARTRHGAKAHRACEWWFGQMRDIVEHAMDWETLASRVRNNLDAGANREVKV